MSRFSNHEVTQGGRYSRRDREGENGYPDCDCKPDIRQITDSAWSSRIKVGFTEFGTPSTPPKRYLQSHVRWQCFTAGEPDTFASYWEKTTVNRETGAETVTESAPPFVDCPAMSYGPPEVTVVSPTEQRTVWTRLQVNGQIETRLTMIETLSQEYTTELLQSDVLGDFPAWPTWDGTYTPDDGTTNEFVQSGVPPWSIQDVMSEDPGRLVQPSLWNLYNSDLAFEVERRRYKILFPALLGSCKFTVEWEEWFDPEDGSGRVLLATRGFSGTDADSESDIFEIEENEEEGSVYVGNARYTALACNVTTAPSAAGAGSASSTYSSKIRVKWGGANGADSYDVYRGSTSTFGDSALLQSGVQSLQFDDTSASADTTYHYWAVAKNSIGAATETYLGTGLRPTAAPAAPNDVDATLTDTAKVRVSWTAPAGASSYDVWRATTNDTSSASSLATGVTDLFYDDTSGTPGVTYYYFVKASGTGGTSDFSPVAAGRREAPVPAAPINVAASDSNASLITVTWDASTYAISYSVWRHTANDSASATLIGTTQETSFIDDSAGSGTTYYYWVKAENFAGASGFSSVDTGIRPAAVPSTPTNVTATQGTEVAQVTVTWDAASGADSYRVYYNTSNSSSGAILIDDAVVGTSFVDTTMTTTGNRYYFVVAENAAGVSGYSSPGALGYAAAPAAPTGVSATDSDSTKIQVTWNAVTGADSYEVWRNTVNNSGSATHIDDTSDLFYDDAGASTNTTYYYWIKAAKNLLTSAFSTSDSGFRPAAAPSAPAWVSASDGSQVGYVAVMWDASAGATGYELWRSDVNDSTDPSMTLIADLGDVQAANDLTLSNTNAYWYFVKAKNSSGSSPFSAGDSGYASVPAAPSAPSTSVGFESITLSWFASSGATGYSVYRGTTNNFALASSIATGVTDLFFEDDTCPFDTTLYYWIVAESAVGDSLPSDSSSTTLPTTVPADASPTGWTGGSGTIGVNWTHTANASYYQMVACASNDINDVAYGPDDMGNGTSYTMTGVAAGTYYVAMRGMNRGAAGNWTTLVSVIVS